MKRIQDLFIFLLYMVLLASCSGESPELKYVGISDKSAVTLMNRSNSDQEVKAVVERIINDRQHGFDWAEFWTKFSESGKFSKLTRVSQLEVVRLFELECSQSVRDAQVRLVINNPIYFDKVVGEKVHCRAPLYGKTFSQLFEALSFQVFDKQQDDDNYSDLLVEHLQSQYELEGASELLLLNFNKHSEAQWVALLIKLIRLNKAKHASSLITIYEDIYGATGLVNLVMVSILESGQFFIDFIKTLSLSKSLDILSRISTSVPLVESVTIEQWDSIAQYLVDELLFGKFKGATESDKFKDGIITYQLMMKFFDNYEKKMNFKNILVWSDQISRRIEVSAKQTENPEAILSEFEQNIHTAWLKQRIVGTLTEDEMSLLSQQSRLGGQLVQLAQKRLEIYSKVDSIEIHHSILDYCTALEEFGVPSKFVSVSHFRIGMLSQPGCLKLTEQTVDSKIEVSEEVIKASLNSVLLTRGASIFFKGKNIDGVIVDATSEIKHANLKVEPPLEIDHALVFPVSFGFKLTEDTSLLPSGTYYIPFHYIHRNAVDGRSAVSAPVKGYKHVETLSVDKVNLEYGAPPYRKGGRVYELQTRADDVYARVHGKSNKNRPWLMRKEAIKGLTAEEIAVKYNIPEVPTHITEVRVPADTLMRKGRVGKNKFGNNQGAVQYELREELLDSNYINTQQIDGVIQ